MKHTTCIMVAAGGRLAGSHKGRQGAVSSLVQQRQQVAHSAFQIVVVVGPKRCQAQAGVAEGVQAAPVAS